MAGQQCWAVVYGPNTWTNMSLKLGKMVPKSRITERQTVPRELRLFDSEYSIYVEGAWSIEITETSGRRSAEHSENALELSRTKLTGSSLLDAVVVPDVGAEFTFSGQSILRVRQEPLLGDSGEAFVSIFWPDRYVVCEASGKIRWHSRQR